MLCRRGRGVGVKITMGEGNVSNRVGGGGEGGRGRGDVEGGHAADVRWRVGPTSYLSFFIPTHYIMQKMQTIATICNTTAYIKIWYSRYLG